MTPPTSPPAGSGPAGSDDETQPIPAGPPIAPEPGRPRRRVDRWGAPPPDARPYRSSFIGMAGMAMMLFVILASGTVMPWWAIAALTVMWLAGLVRGTRWFLVHPTRVLLLPVLMCALWLGVLMGGVLLFGWGS
jgi:hypothetical protein